MQPASSSLSPSGAAGVGRDRPRFRQDLIAETVEHQGARFIDVMAPDGDNVFRFYEVEYSLACAMDGERDIAGIVKWAQDELGLTPSPQEVRTVIATLGDLGFIDATAEAPELAPAGTHRTTRPTPAPDFELGDAGADHADTERGVPLPPAPELSLGAAGSPRTARPTPQPFAAVALGAPGRAGRPTPAPPHASDSSDVSVDLSDHIAVRPDDVKEAVRASRVMSAVEPPPDDREAGQYPDAGDPLREVSGALQMIQDPPTAPASAFDAPTVARIPDPAMLAELTPRPPPQFARSPEPPRVSEAARSQPQDLPTADTIRVGKLPLRAPAATTKPPVELPAAPVTVKVDKPMPPPHQQRSGTNPLLLVVVILAVVGAGVFFAWKYILERPAIDVDTSSAPMPSPVKPAPPPAPPPPPPSAKIVLETPDPEDVKVSRQGVIEAIASADTAVKETEVIAKLKGNKPLDAQVNAMTADLARQRTLLEAATKRFDAVHAAGNKGAEASYQKEIAERHQLIDAKENALSAKRADYDTYLVHAARNGKFVPSAKPGTPVAADALIGKIVREAIPVATFKIASTRSFAGNGSVEVAIHKGEQRLTCTVADVQADSVKVTCPVDPELTEGTEVALQAPGATTAAPPEPPPMPSGGAGNAAGSAAPSENSAAPAGGATAPAAGGSAEPAGTPGSGAGK